MMGKKGFYLRTAAAAAVVAAILAAVFRFGLSAKTHDDIYEAVVDSSSGVKSHVDSRCDLLERKLDRIEGKIDRLLKIAEGPLPDGMKPPAP